jgi:hypothetical protein
MVRGQEENKETNDGHRAHGTEGQSAQAVALLNGLAAGRLLSGRLLGGSLDGDLVGDSSLRVERRLLLGAEADLGALHGSSWRFRRQFPAATTGE